MDEKRQKGKEEMEWFNHNTKHFHIHGKNILAKIRSGSFLLSSQGVEFRKVVKDYKKWNNNNEKLRGYSRDTIRKRVRWLNDYKADVKDIKYSFQSKFHSTIIEEFLYYIFRDLIIKLNDEANSNNKKDPILLGNAAVYCNLYFEFKNYNLFTKNPNMRINIKNQDFAIYRPTKIKIEDKEKIINIPIVSIECKTWLDKTMLDGAITTAEAIKRGNMNSLFLIVTELYNVSYNVNPVYSRVDRIFSLKKDTKYKVRGASDSLVCYDVVESLFDTVENHLEREPPNIEENLMRRGVVL